MRAGLAGDGVVGWGGNRFAIPTLLGDFGLGEGKPHYGLWGLRFMDFCLLFVFVCYLFLFVYLFCFFVFCFYLFIYLFLPIFHLRPAERDMPLRPPEWIMAWA